MKSLLISFVASLLLSTSAPSATDTAYVCNGGSSKKYHLVENCRGLNNCSTKIEKTTVKDAVKRGRTLCGFED